MSGGRPRSTLDGMTGDFLPNRRQASVRTQLLAVVVLVAAVAGGIYLLS
ncbi:hypothetical protein GCM10009789_48170 [Kribbella sancticallisti]|uniref:Uncharacterized protein n=1 Tax=Kribbella sancticallisti TaxID=460087 RepID=A0ABN2DWJ6_9ACTN